MNLDNTHGYAKSYINYGKVYVYHHGGENDLVKAQRILENHGIFLSIDQIVTRSKYSKNNKLHLIVRLPGANDRRSIRNELLSLYSRFQKAGNA